jgi:hypothetical protein
MARSRSAKDYSPNDSLYTPPEIFEMLNVVFDVDVCAPTGGLHWIPAKRSIDELEDGLAVKWSGLVWMNPPYSNPTPWIDKWLLHSNGFALVPFSSANWFIRLWDSKAICWAVNRNITFINKEGLRKPIFMPTGLWAIGDEAINALNDSGMDKIR